MTGLSTNTRTELAHRSGDGIDVTLVWVQGAGEDRTLVCVRDTREGPYPTASHGPRSPAPRG